MTTDNTHPKYREAIGLITNYIQTNGLKPGTRLPSERDFCEMWGYSQPTVNKAITILVTDGQLFRKGRKLFIASSEIKNTDAIPSIHVLCHHAEFQRTTLIRHDLIEAAHDVAAALGTNAIPVLARNPSEQRQQLINLLKNRIAGFVIWPLNYTSLNDLYDQFRQNNIPFVLCDADVESFDFVGIDNQLGSTMAVQHLHALGHRHLAYISDNFAISAFKRRCMGYQSTCFNMGLQQSIKRVIELSEATKETAASAVHTLLNDWPEVTGLFCSTDILAIHVMEALKEQGKKIPEDFSVVGFDDIDASQTSTPPLTTLSQDFYQMGVIAVERLFSRMKPTSSTMQPHPWRLRMEPIMVIRESTSRPRSESGAH